MRRPVLTLLFGIVATTACAAASGGSSVATAGNSAVVTSAEIAAADIVSSAYDLVVRLRPGWLATRGATSFRAGPGQTMVAVDDAPLQASTALERISARDVKEMRYLSATDAVQRFGTLTAGGQVIVVVTRRN